MDNQTYTILAGTYNSELLTFTFTPPNLNNDGNRNRNRNNGSLILTSTTSTSSSPYTNPSPSWLQPHPKDKNSIFVSDESQNGRAISLKIDKQKLLKSGHDHHGQEEEGGITFVDQHLTQGSAPAMLGTSLDGNWIFGANYGSASILPIPLLFNHSSSQSGISFDTNSDQQLIKFNGTGPVTDRQEAPHPHMAIENKATGTVFVPDLGADKIHELRYSPSKKTWSIIQNITITPPGTGPRHLAFSPSGKAAYLISEVANSIQTFDIVIPPPPSKNPKNLKNPNNDEDDDDDGDGEDGDDEGKISKWNHVQTESILPPNAKPIDGLGLGAGEILLAGKFVYASNRNDANPSGDAITIFPLSTTNNNNSNNNDELTTLGTPTYVRSQGQHIRGMEFDPFNKKYLIVGNMLSNSVVVFKRDQETGGLEFIDKVELKNGTQTTSFVWI